nr:hypothetical protein [Bacteroidota bacterium]
MQKSKDSFLDKIHAHLFTNRDELPVVFKKDEQDMVIRYRAAFTKWLGEPHLRDIDLINYLKNEYNVSESIAYRDLPRIKALIGNVKLAGKEFQRYRATEMILKGYSIAKEATGHLEVKQAVAMIKAAEALVKVHKLDKDELEEFPWDEIIPLSLEPSTDVSVMGQKRIKDLEALQQKLREKYGGNPIEDTTFIEMPDDEKD